ncbi:hypothetical protein L249_2168 [Ophiocordyceps polyrhachis-furcata BCC 54312]|uniref:SAM-dependent MTase RsmB/NOP-type domain-containing protein n=1 Tax=Ophiocordyceps polyrhachis-furcata BCC 54312 TaxID=1330021 RepID=A0A367LS45_9HYPO|nr:hypothetical protein L249_2168 [Ophiocordyceps polyrhachis-furcata BCC 54312]
MSLYHEAAEILSKAQSEGGSLKSLVFGGKKAVKSQPNQLYALVVETTKWSSVLKEVIEAAELLKQERKLTPVLSLLLVHDLLLTKRGISLAQNHGLRASVERHKGRLKSEITRARLRRRASSLQDLAAQVHEAAAGEETAASPRWVRINSLKSSVEEQLETTFASYARAACVADVVSKTDRRHIYIDTHVPNLVAITPGTDLTKTGAYLSGKVILQDKASCFPAYLLDPRFEDGDVIDACAAPGNKTSHLAAIIEAHRPTLPLERQTIFAFEKDARRAQTLDERMRAAGCKRITRIGFAQDFALVDPHGDRYSKVGALLLDPSCSGSGIIGRDWMPQLFLPGTPKKAVTSKKRKRRDGDGGTTGPDKKKMKVVRDDETAEDRDLLLSGRLKALSSFQLALLLHALRFPAAKKVTYSTCSVYAEENERVVMEALKSDVARTRGWRILARGQQVRGMREWPVRGLKEECEGEAEVADGCIRCYKDDGRGTMGFFVAAFCRDGDGDGEEAGSDGAEPYVRDEHGRIVRDVLGMPTLKTTGEGGGGGGGGGAESKRLDGGEDDEGKDKEKVAGGAGSQAAGPDGDASDSDLDEDGDDDGGGGDDDDDDEWGGFGD